jgi:hypothetical protein
MSPVPKSINGQLLTTEDLHPKEHQIFFRRMGENATGVNFHHEHIPISLDKVNHVADSIIQQFWQRQHIKWFYIPLTLYIK